MLIQVVIKRQARKGKVECLLSLLKELRSGAIRQPGYISGETLIKVFPMGASEIDQ